MSRYFSSDGSLQKTRFYVWFLGSEECEGLRGRQFVVPTIENLIDRANRYPPQCKVTVEISKKGMKIIQTIPSINTRGKLKMELIKLRVPSYSITFSCIGPYPFTDVVSCILLLWNPNTRCPVHTHCYRCDSPETASIMHTALQILVDRPENQRALMDVEKRLMQPGLLLMKTYKGDYFQKSVYRENDQIQIQNSKLEFSRRNEISEKTTDERVSCLHQAVFNELKEKLQKKGPILLPPKDYTIRIMRKGIHPSQMTLVKNQNAQIENQFSDEISSAISTARSGDTAGSTRKTHGKLRLFGDTIRGKLNQISGKRNSNLDFPPPIMPAHRNSNFPPLSQANRDGNSNFPPLSQANRDGTSNFPPLSHRNGNLNLNFPPSLQPAYSKRNLNFPSEKRRLAISNWNLASYGSGQERRISTDGNWIITRPFFTSMQDLSINADRKIPRINRVNCTSPIGEGGHAGGRSIVCDPFGSKYERRTTVKHFWNNTELPTKIEDEYGVWYLAPSVQNVS